MTYILMNKDNPWLVFSCERDEYDEVQLKELTWLTELRPLGYADLFSFLDRRKALNIENTLNNCLKDTVVQISTVLSESLTQFPLTIPFG